MLETIGRWMERHPRLSRLAASALCRRDVPLNSAWQTIGWWETRRIPYNLVVGSAGIFSSAVIVTIGLVGYFLFHSEFPAPTGLTIIAVIIDALIANLCYTGGWLAEIIGWVNVGWFGLEELHGSGASTIGAVIPACIA